jgi:hypothetical protein
MSGVVIGIDPGISTGFAIYKNGNLSVLDTIHPEDLHDRIISANPALVVFEDSRQQSKVWLPGRKSASAATDIKIARNVGQIDAWCILIERICMKAGIKCIGISPSEKGHKLARPEFDALTGWRHGSNQHERDAAIVARLFRFQR